MHTKEYTQALVSNSKLEAVLAASRKEELTALQKT
jgi:hypothetical protein